MEDELNYLSEKIEKLEGYIEKLESVSENYTTEKELSFYIRSKTALTTELSILNNILNAITINLLS